MLFVPRIVDDTEQAGISQQDMLILSFGNHMRKAVHSLLLDIKRQQQKTYHCMLSVYFLLQLLLGQCGETSYHTHLFKSIKTKQFAFIGLACLSKVNQKYLVIIVGLE